MDTTVLVKSQRQASGELLEALKDKRFPMTAAFWQYLPDAETWRLFIATALVDEIGSIGAYTKLQTLLNELPENIAEEFSVANITLLSPTAKQLLNLKKHYGQDTRRNSQISRIDLSSDEAYVHFFE